MGKKHQKLKKRVAVLPVLMKKCKSKKKKCKIYLITSREQGQWIIPTGKLEKNLSNRQVARLEAFEEAGILGKLDEQFKVQVQLQSPRGKKKRKTTVFLLHVKRILNQWPEKDERKRKSISIESYVKTLSDKKLKRKLRAI
ncbi:NUDIX hydrolase [Granulosicoccus antarcticus]|uniref:Nudix hydrolase domain-containing protein n=1 Tax=Granulosicoccus antarcticus IMCC3135 TaxID=1192854 RepID=A0A2Z2NY36_9GAMM|nr:NUDIX domain-containing protein [Granulosicoccus antarcticus]ASJ76362.1 hypothetical protein IMCC3135_31575 [Granulosicoccus antarcticus IMCC3135]